jgi:hypothetical protein
VPETIEQHIETAEVMISAHTQCMLEAWMPAETCAERIAYWAAEIERLKGLRFETETVEENRLP